MTLVRWLTTSLVLGSLSVAGAAAAQVTIVPEFAAGPGTVNENVGNTDVAVGTDGSILFAWTAFTGTTHVSTRHFSAAGVPLAATQSIADPAARYMRALVADAEGGYTLAIDDVGISAGGLWGRTLDAAGLPTAPMYQVGNPSSAGITAPTLASTTDGSVFLWYQDGDFHGHRHFLPPGGSFGFRVDFGNPSIVNLATAAAGLPDGGFVLAWSYFASSGGLVARLRVYERNADPRSAIIDVGGGKVLLTDVGANPTGGFAAVGIRFPGDFDQPTEVVAFRYASNGTPLGATTLATLPANVVGLAKIAFDAAGHALVVWTEYRFMGPNQFFLRNRGRGMATDGTPFAQPFTIADRVYDPIHTAALGDSTFVNVWGGLGTAQANVVGLCTPAVAQCGDGTRVADCEECDDGAANSNTTPDACRTDCTLPRCGDGVADLAHGEECDDGNDQQCDGCTPWCTREIGLVCGDGARVPGCTAEQCDDGNTVVGDGCSPDCTLEQAAGSGNKLTDCMVAWTVDNPTNSPLRDAHGAFRATQTCIDDDPACDFDGGVPGSCTFHVEVCANTFTMTCPGFGRLFGWELRQPSPAKAAKHPELAAVRAALAAVPASIIGPVQSSLCSDWLAVPVMLRGANADAPGKLLLEDRARDYDGRQDVDKLKLVCLPAAP